MADKSVTFDLLARDRASQAFKNVGQASDGLHSKFSKLGGAATTLAKGALIGGVGAAVTGLAVVFKTGIGEVSDYQKGFAQLQQGLKTTHGAAGLTAKQMEALASNIQDYSGQTDDSIVATEQLLLTFTNIHDAAGKNNDIFTQTTKIAADMAARLGGDASGAAIQLGKALNDPVKGITALTRVGVSFDAGQIKQIKTLTAHGKTMQAQKIILKELNKEFGGSAKAVGDTLPGMIDKAKRHFEDWSQSLVTKMLPALTDLAHFVGDKVIPFMQKLAEQGFAKLLPAIQTVSQIISEHLVPAFQTIVGFVQQNILPIFQAFANFIITKLYPALGKILGGALDGLRKAFQQISQTVAAHRQQLQTLGHFIQRVAEIAVKILAPVLSFVLKNAFRVLGAAISVIITIIANLVGGAAQVVHFFTGPFLRAIGRFTSIATRGFKFLADTWFTVIGGMLSTAAAAFGSLPGGIGRGLKDAAYVFRVFRGTVDGTLSGVAADAGSWGHKTGANLALGVDAGLAAYAGQVQSNGFRFGLSVANAVRNGAAVKSPSKITTYVGKMVGQGLINGMDSMRASVKAAADRLTSQIQAMRQNIASMASGISSSLTGAFDLSNAPNLSVGGVTNFLSSGLAATRRFNHLIHQLIARHVSPAVIQQIVGMGIGPGTALATNLVGATNGQLNQIDRLYGGIASVNANTGNLVAQQQYGHKLDRMVKSLHGLEQTVKHLSAEIRGAQHKSTARA